MLLAAVAASAAALRVTLSADFLTYPGWLAVQKADFILGPVVAGLYWQRRRPQSRFGPMLIGFGFIGALYILQSASNSWLFSIGLLAETALGLATRVLILAFPTGRLDRPAKVILVISILVSPVPSVLTQLLSPQTGAGASISGCLRACPRNELAVTSNPELAAKLLETFRFGVILASTLTAGLLVWRYVTGTPPQRRALAIGTPIALLFLGFQITFQVLGALDAPPSDFSEFVTWGIVGARAALWYGFLAALIAAELYASTAMRRLVGQSLRRPSKHELEAMLRGPLGDPDLRLVFLDGARQPPPAEPGRDVKIVRHEGAPTVAIVHDPQLDDDPELLEAAGAVALLAAENAELDAGWTEALQELERSRARLVRAADDERRKVERNLHDSVQQLLISIKLRLENRGRGRTFERVEPRAAPRDLAQRRGRAHERPGDRARALPAIADRVGAAHRAACLQRVRRLAAGDRRRRDRPLSAGDRSRGLLLLPGGDPERRKARRAGRPRLGRAGRGGTRAHVPRRRRRTGVPGGRGARPGPAEHGGPPGSARRAADDRHGARRQHGLGKRSRAGYSRAMIEGSIHRSPW